MIIRPIVAFFLQIIAKLFAKINFKSSLNKGYLIIILHQTLNL